MLTLKQLLLAWAVFGHAIPFSEQRLVFLGQKLDIPVEQNQYQSIKTCKKFIS